MSPGSAAGGGTAADQAKGWGGGPGRGLRTIVLVAAGLLGLLALHTVAWRATVAHMPEVQVPIHFDGQEGPKTGGVYYYEACMKDAKVVDSVATDGPLANRYSALELVYSKHCAMAWPRLIFREGGEGPAGSVHVVTLRTSPEVSVEALVFTFRSVDQPHIDIIGKELTNLENPLTNPAKDTCVFAEAWFEATPGVPAGARVRTSCYRSESGAGIPLSRSWWSWLDGNLVDT